MNITGKEHVDLAQEVRTLKDNVNLSTLGLACTMKPNLDVKRGINVIFFTGKREPRIIPGMVLTIQMHRMFKSCKKADTKTIVCFPIGTHAEMEEATCIE